MKKIEVLPRKKTAVASPTGSASMSFDDRRKTTTSLVMLRPKPRIGFVTSAYGPMSSRRTVDARMCVIRGLEMRGIDLCRKVGHRRFFGDEGSSSMHPSVVGYRISSQARTFRVSSLKFAPCWMMASRSLCRRIGRSLARGPAARLNV